MRILYDDEVFFRQRFGGVSRIFATLIKRITSLQEHELVFNAGYSENEYLLQLKPTTFSFFKNYNFPLKGKIIRGIYGALSHRKTNAILASQSVDLFHPTFYANYYINTLQKSKVPLVFTVHDLIHEKTNNNSHYQHMAAIKAQNIKLAKEIIVVSNHTKKDLLELYPFVNPNQVHVIHLAQSLPTNGQKPANLPNNYILFTGERGGYKNFSSLLHAFALLSKHQPHLHLYCAGSSSFSSTEIELANTLEVAQKIHQAKLSDEELSYVYKHAEVFVYPSTYEGFGIPLLEAFNAGVPVIAHNATSLPEVAGNAALLVDATQPTELVNAIQLLQQNATLKHDLVAKGYARAAEFTWEKHVQQTLEVYKKAVR
jgi:glycosyltransferase involved in cell wall biosynthesis